MAYLRLLGEVVLEDETGAIEGPVTRRYPLAVLALLATANSRRLSRSKLVGYLWPDAAEKTARRRLNTHLYQIRSRLGEEAVASIGDDVWLTGRALDCDVFQFEAAIEAGRLEEAVELYGGPLLEGFELSGSSLRESHLDGERARLRHAYWTALEALAEAAEDRGETSEAARWWRQRAHEDPYDSGVARRLMEALAREGNAAAALQVARVHGQLLEREFGTEPGPAVRGLVEALRRAPGRLVSPSTEMTRTERGQHGRGARPSGRSHRPFPASLRPGLIALVALGLLAAAATGGWYLLGAGGSSSPGTTGRTVAVLPFESLRTEATNPFSEGLHSELVTRLAGVAGLEVVSRGSVLRFRETERPVREIARELGAHWLVRGELQQAGDEVQLNVRLVQASRDRQVWAESYRTVRTAPHLFEIQGEITRAIVRALEVRLSPREERRLAAVPTENTAAYELYLQARELAEDGDRSVDPGRNLQGMQLYRRALELDSGFAEAWAGLADAHVDQAWMSGAARWMDSARMAARRALDLDPGLATAHAQLGDVRLTLGQTGDAIASYERALELQPSYWEAINNLTTLLHVRGRFADAIRWLDRWHRISPGVSVPIVRLYHVNATLGRDSVAEAWRVYGRERGHALSLQEFFVALARGQPDAAREVWSERMTGEAEHTTRRAAAALALYEGDWREARREYRALYPGVSWGPGALFLGLLWDPLGLAHALDRLGDRDAALEIAREVAWATDSLPDAIHKEWVYDHRRAIAHLILGDTTAALGALEASVDVGYRDAGELRHVPTLASLRSHPRFQALLVRMEILVAEERRRVEAEGWGLPD